MKMGAFANQTRSLAGSLFPSEPAVKAAVDSAWTARRGQRRMICQNFAWNELVGWRASAGPALTSSRGEVDLETLSAEDKRKVESLFQSQGSAQPSQVRDGFLYRIARTTPGGGGVETIEVPEAVVPSTISQCVKDELV